MRLGIKILVITSLLFLVVGVQATDSTSIPAQHEEPLGIYVSSDHMYESGRSPYGVHRICEYSLSTSWSVSSASLVNCKTSQDTDPKDISFNSHGTKMYEVGEDNKQIYEYSLSTPWDVSTAAYVTSKSIDKEDIKGFFFKPDGSKLYVAGGDYIYEYSLSTPWDVSTATLDYKLSSKGYSYDVYILENGGRMYYLDYGLNQICKYSLSSNWDLSTASYEGGCIPTKDSLPTSIFFKPDGSEMYETGYNDDLIYQTHRQPEIGFTINAVQAVTAAAGAAAIAGLGLYWARYLR